MCNRSQYLGRGRVEIFPNLILLKLVLLFFPLFFLNKRIYLFIIERQSDKERVKQRREIAFTGPLPRCMQQQQRGQEKRQQPGGSRRTQVLVFLVAISEPSSQLYCSDDLLPQPPWDSGSREGVLTISPSLLLCHQNKSRSRILAGG